MENNGVCCDIFTCILHALIMSHPHHSAHSCSSHPDFSLVSYSVPNPFMSSLGFHL